MAGSRRPRAIKSLQDQPDKGGRNWLIYGDSGSGKTVLAGTAPRSLMLLCEAAGAESAKMFGSDVDVWVLDSWKDFQEAYRYIDEGTGAEDYEWITIDSLSELEEYCWAHVMRANSRPANKAAIQDYPEVWSKMKEAVDKWNRLPINVLYTAQSFRLIQASEEEADSTVLLPLIGSTKRGDTAQKICGKVTLVGYLDVRFREAEDAKEDDPLQPFRRLWLEKTARMFAKSRHHKGVRYLDEPVGEDVYLDIFEINEEIKANLEAGRAAREAKRGARTSVVATSSEEEEPGNHPSDTPPDLMNDSDPATETSDKEPPRRKRRRSEAAEKQED